MVTAAECPWIDLEKIPRAVRVLSIGDDDFLTSHHDE